MSKMLSRVIATSRSDPPPEEDATLITRFRTDPASAYGVLLERYSSTLLRMIWRFIRDSDEVMEVYTTVCERLRANDYQALRHFRDNSCLLPWLSVVVANACRDRMRARTTVSRPQTVLRRLDARQKLVFKYYYQEHVPYEDIAEVISGRHSMACTPLDVLDAIREIDALLSIKKRWILLTALNANRSRLSLDALREDGFQLVAHDGRDDFDEAFRQRPLLDRLKNALAELDPEDQLLVLLRFEQGMTAVQIAKVLEYDCHKYVYTRLRTILGWLREALEVAVPGDVATVAPPRNNAA